MANVDSVSVAPQHGDLLRDAVGSGTYASASEVIREAMRDWAAKWQQRSGDIEKLREVWAEGEASGAATSVDFDDTLAEARQELKTARGRGG
ncbi:ribbon-helix-helix domain-containing protein [Rhizobium leguminosarum]|uniref:ribbon-helix-helix domain-containing protein n=1 Tax=Rhizobium leguminosarum TaxID=384 RepID=UPI003D08F253